VAASALLPEGLPNPVDVSTLPIGAPQLVEAGSTADVPAALNDLLPVLKVRSDAVDSTHVLGNAVRPRCAPPPVMLNGDAAVENVV